MATLTYAALQFKGFSSKSRALWNYLTNSLNPLLDHTSPNSMDYRDVQKNALYISFCDHFNSHDCTAPLIMYFSTCINKTSTNFMQNKHFGFISLAHPSHGQSSFLTSHLQLNISQWRSKLIILRHL